MAFSATTSVLRNAYNVFVHNSRPFSVSRNSVMLLRKEIEGLRNNVASEWLSVNPCHSSKKRQSTILEYSILIIIFLPLLTSGSHIKNLLFSPAETLLYLIGSHSLPCKAARSRRKFFTPYARLIEFIADCSDLAALTKVLEASGRFSVDQFGGRKCEISTSTSMRKPPISKAMRL